MIIAVEDHISELVVKKLIETFRPDLVHSNFSPLAKKGRTYLQSKAQSLNRTASTIPVFLLVDGDDPNICPINLINSWVGVKQPNLLFRIAIVEVETWLIADKTNLAHFLSIASSRLPDTPEALLQPKEKIVNLAQNSRKKEIREDMVPKPSGTARVGPGYNFQLGTFVTNRWDPREASTRSESLRRAIIRLQGL